MRMECSILAISRSRRVMIRSSILYLTSYLAFGLAAAFILACLSLL